MIIDLEKYLFPFFAYLKYWLRCEDKYSLQSPFVYKVHLGLLDFLKTRKNQDLDIEAIRKKLLKDKTLLQIEDYGAGSKKVPQKFREIGDITRYSTSNRKFSQLYQYFCSLTPALQVLELGTCVGLNTIYLSRVTKGQLHSLEGSEALWKTAQQIADSEQINYLLGPIQGTLAPLLKSLDKVDFALIDATHTYEGTMAYFKSLLPHLHHQSIEAIADIHWSKDMEKAWNEIQAHTEISLSFDFYECGIAFFSPNHPKSHYILEF